MEYSRCTIGIVSRERENWRGAFFKLPFSLTRKGSSFSVYSSTDAEACWYNIQVEARSMILIFQRSLFVECRFSAIKSHKHHDSGEDEQEERRINHEEEDEGRTKTLLLWMTIKYSCVFDMPSFPLFNSDILSSFSGSWLAPNRPRSLFANDHLLSKRPHFLLPSWKLDTRDSFSKNDSNFAAVSRAFFQTQKFRRTAGMKKPMENYRIVNHSKIAAAKSVFHHFTKERRFSGRN